MSAIVRHPMGIDMARTLLEDAQASAAESSTNEYYIGIGKSDVFNVSDSVIEPVDSPRDEREFRLNLQSIKKVEDSIFVAKRVNWSSGTIYCGWDDATDPEHTPSWYVLNDAKEVYVCLEPGRALDGTSKPSMVDPNWGLYAPMSPQTDPNNPEYDPNHPMFNVREWWKEFKTADDYVWKFLYSITPENIYQFLSSNHIPVQQPEDSLPLGDNIEDLQWKVKDTAVGGQIIDVHVVDGGSGYTSDPTIEVVGNGADATVQVHRVDGVIKRATVTTYGAGYQYASLHVNGGGGVGAVLRPVITGPNGIGYDAIDDLKTSSIIMNIKPDGDVNGTFTVQNTFRQMGLIKNPKEVDGTTPYTGVSVKTLPSLILTGTSPFAVGEKIRGRTSEAVAYVNQSDGDTVYYHQNESTGFKVFQNEAVEQVGVSGIEAQVQMNVTKNGIDRFSGEILYIENRYRIRRDEEQQEDIKIVITV